MSKLPFWSFAQLGNIAIATQTTDGCLDIVANGKGNPDFVFTESQINDLFKTLKDGGFPVRSAGLSLYGEDGKIEPAIKKHNAKKGKDYPYAYSAEQVAEFDAKGIIVKERFTGYAKEPLVMAFLKPSTGSGGNRNATTLKRAGGNIPVDPAEQTARVGKALMRAGVKAKAGE